MNPSNNLADGVLESAQKVGMSRAYLWKEIAAGRLRSFKVGNRRLIAREDLQAWLNKYRNGPGQAA